jgi:tetratricopeptide (TPR) repeat protein
MVGKLIRPAILAVCLALPAGIAWAAPALPWDGDRAALMAAQAGVTAAKAETLEAALRHGARFFPNGAVRGGIQYVLADGGTETMLVQLAAAAESRKTSGGVMPVEPVENFYPGIALALARFYAAAGRPADAVRVLDAGLSLSPSPDGAVGAHVAAMMGMKAEALTAMGKFAEAADIYDQALASHVLGDADRRALTEGRLRLRKAEKKNPQGGQGPR